MSSPCSISSAFESFCGSSVVVAGAVSVSSPPPPPQPATISAAKAASRNRIVFLPGLLTGAKLAGGLDAFAGLTGKLRPRGSNPDFLVQSEACCHYTRPQWHSLRIRDSGEGS